MTGWQITGLVAAGYVGLAAALVAFIARAGRVLNHSPQHWICASCGQLFLRPVHLAVHLEDVHPGDVRALIESATQ